MVEQCVRKGGRAGLESRRGVSYVGGLGWEVRVGGVGEIRGMVA